MSTIDTAAARTAPVASRTRLIVATIAILIVSIALPFVFLPMTEEQHWAHAVFHVLGIITCVSGVLVQRALRRGATRTVRVLSWIVTVLLCGWLLGHVGELATVFASGGVESDETVFQNPVHEFFATIAVPSWMLSVVTTLVLLVAIGAQALAARMRASRPAS